ncbi:hypothetical protein TIFTF001_003997 [Ficus carica]|uniref:Uncharacterized protein n=1 Tax=Ficus carica TaxID=3494 RepID=A0AA88CSJ1_FICCA|nr:hypothetical protein TIFTF001_003997 [Ficus carica]
MRSDRRKLTLNLLGFPLQIAMAIKSIGGGDALDLQCTKTGRPQTAKRAIKLVEQHLSKDGWPEYYDGNIGCHIGKQARKYKTWSICGSPVGKTTLPIS